MTSASNLRMEAPANKAYADAAYKSVLSLPSLMPINLNLKRLYLTFLFSSEIRNYRQGFTLSASSCWIASVSRRGFNISYEKKIRELATKRDMRT